MRAIEGQVVGVKVGALRAFRQRTLMRTQGAREG
jgi:hypothetical protein